MSPPRPKVAGERHPGAMGGGRSRRYPACRVPGKDCPATRTSARRRPPCSSSGSSPGTPAGRVSPAVLVAPADLVFDGAYPASGWRRCDDYSIDRTLEQYRRTYKITSSIAAVWEYGTRCAGGAASNGS